MAQLCVPYSYRFSLAYLETSCASYHKLETFVLSFCIYLKFFASIHTYTYIYIHIHIHIYTYIYKVSAYSPLAVNLSGCRRNLWRPRAIGGAVLSSAGTVQARISIASLLCLQPSALAVVYSAYSSWRHQLQRLGHPEPARACIFHADCAPPFGSSLSLNLS